MATVTPRTSEPVVEGYTIEVDIEQAEMILSLLGRVSMASPTSEVYDALADAGVRTGVYEISDGYSKAEVGVLMLDKR